MMLFLTFPICQKNKGPRISPGTRLRDFPLSDITSTLTSFRTRPQCERRKRVFCGTKHSWLKLRLRQTKLVNINLNNLPVRSVIEAIEVRDIL